MNITVDGNNVNLDLDPAEALSLIAKLADTISKANLLGSWTHSQGMPLRMESLKQDFPGVVNICVSKEKMI